MKNGRMNVAIIGCGNISVFHADAIKANSDKANLYAVCDIIGEKAQTLAQKYSVSKYFIDYKEMLKDGNIDLVCICTPSGTHAEIAVSCGEAGKHVLCEKPLDITHEKLNMITEAFKRTGMKFGSVFQYRTYSGLKNARNILNSGDLGKILIANGYCKIYRSAEYYKSAGWRGTWAMDGGGCLMNQAIHSLDVLCWLTGGVERLKADTYTLARDIEVEDTAFVSLKFKNKAYGQFFATTLAYPGIGVQIEIQCEGGRIEFNDTGTTLFKVDENGKEIHLSLDEEAVDGVNAANNPSAISNTGHNYFVADMINAIVKDTQPYISPEEGRYAVDVILAIYQSSTEKREVLL